MAGRRALMASLRQRASDQRRGGTLPAPQLSAALTSLEILTNEPNRVVQLRANSERLRRGLARLGYQTLGSDTPIVPISLASGKQTLDLVDRCRAEGLLVAPDLCPEGLEPPRIRNCVTACHTEGEIDFALGVYARSGVAIGLE